MSERRKAGDVVLKRRNAGFVGREMVVELMPQDPEWDEPCILDCGDPGCIGWNDCHEVDASGVKTGRMACHVYECQMADIPRGDDTDAAH